MTTTVLLETMAGKGTEIGRSFEELKEILDGVKLDNKMGVCMDTCHIYDGGYDIVNDLDGVLDEFDRIIGLDRLKAIHMNDSKILLQAIKTDTKKSVKAVSVLILWLRLSTTLNYRVIPILLETPNELDGYKKKFKCLENHILCKSTHNSRKDEETIIPRLFFFIIFKPCSESTTHSTSAIMSSFHLFYQFCIYIFQCKIYTLIYKFISAYINFHSPIVNFL